MEDFFDGQSTEEMDVSSTLPPSNHKKSGKTVRLVTAIGLAVVAFLVGCFSVWFALDKEIRTLAKVKAIIDREYYQEIDDEIFYGALFDTVNQQLDDYSYYMTADEYTISSDSLAGRRAGIGLVFSVKTPDNEDQMKIVRVCGNSPAEDAEIAVGSYIIGFGKKKDDMQASERFSQFSEFLSTCTEEEAFWLRLRVGNGERDVQICKRAYVESYVFYKTNEKSYSFCGDDATQLTEKGAPMSCLNADTAYLRLVQFGGEAENAFAQVMELFKTEGKKNLVLDLRENGGGYVDVMREIASYFCKGATERKPLAAVADFGNKKKGYKATGNLYDDYFTQESRICVLADNGTASASESLIGCMLDYGAISYGDICLSKRDGVAKTFGKGIMQATYFMSVEKDALKLTTAEVKWPLSGTSIHGRGILPQDGTKVVEEGIDDEQELTSAIKTLFQE